MRLLILVAMLLPVSAAAGDFAERYPAGSIRDEAAARAALKDSDAELSKITKDAKARDTECYRGVLVNSCRDDVRRSKELAEREVRRVRVEARDVQRKIEAERVAKRRADSAAANAAKDAQRSLREEKVRNAADERAVAVKQLEESAGKNAESQMATPTAEVKRPAKDRLTAAERNDNARKFQEKQVQAQQRARHQEAERKENEKRRAEKRTQTEQREAEREAIRKKAAESVN